MKYPRITKKQLLAAETFSYSYANYADHIEINPRFYEYMPRDIDIVEEALAKGRGADGIAKKLKISKEEAEEFLESYLEAKEIVDSKNAAESFRKGIKASIKFALEKGLNTDEDIDQLVGQICYRAADFAYLLDLEGKELSDYSKELREE